MATFKFKAKIPVAERSNNREYYEVKEYDMTINALSQGHADDLLDTIQGEYYVHVTSDATQIDKGSLYSTDEAGNLQL